VKDYLLLLLFTGLRREEGLSLAWSQVDLRAKTLTVPDPKNRQPHVLPLSDFLHDLLAQSDLERTDSAFVFPGGGVKGYLNEPRKQMQKVIEEPNIAFTLHDLRRTFITVAESLDISAYALKRLANHKMANDVTAGYIISDVQRLREPMRRITDFLLASMNAVTNTDTDTDTVTVTDTDTVTVTVTDGLRIPVQFEFGKNNHDSQLPKFSSVEGRADFRIHRILRRYCISSRSASYP
jgi:hypothetical protein